MILATMDQNETDLPSGIQPGPRNDSHITRYSFRGAGQHIFVPDYHVGTRCGGMFPEIPTIADTGYKDWMVVGIGDWIAD